MHHLNAFFLGLFLVLTATGIGSQTREVLPIDVLHYDITLEPDIAQKTLAGTASIKFTSNVQGLTTVEFDCGDLVVDSVRQGGASREFAITNHHLSVSLKQ